MIKTSIKQRSFDMKIYEHAYEDINLVLGYCTYFFGSIFYFLILKYLFFAQILKVHKNNHGAPKKELQLLGCLE